MNHKAIRQELYKILATEESEEKIEVLDGLVKYSFVNEDTIASMNSNIEQAIGIINELNAKVQELETPVEPKPESKKSPAKKAEPKDKE